MLTVIIAQSVLFVRVWLSLFSIHKGYIPKQNLTIYTKTKFDGRSLHVPSWVIAINTKAIVVYIL